MKLSAQMQRVSLVGFGASPLICIFSVTASNRLGYLILITLYTFSLGVLICLKCYKNRTYGTFCIALTSSCYSGMTDPG